MSNSKGRLIGMLAALTMLGACSEGVPTRMSEDMRLKREAIDAVTANIADTTARRTIRESLLRSTEGAVAMPQPMGSGAALESPRPKVQAPASANPSASLEKSGRRANDNTADEDGASETEPGNEGGCTVFIVDTCTWYMFGIKTQWRDCPSSISASPANHPDQLWEVTGGQYYYTAGGQLMRTYTGTAYIGFSSYTVSGAVGCSVGVGGFVATPSRIG